MLIHYRLNRLRQGRLPDDVSDRAGFTFVLSALWLQILVLEIDLVCLQSQLRSLLRFHLEDKITPSDPRVRTELRWMNLAAVERVEVFVPDRVYD